MKNLLIQFVATFTAVALALAGYEFYRQSHEAEVQAQTQALQQQAQALSQQSTNLANQVEKERSDADELKQRYVNLANLVEGINAAGTAKTYITEYYMSNGKWPASNKEAGLPEPGEFKGQSLKRLEVADNGFITVTFNEKSGVDGGTIQLQPDTGNMAMGIRWSCITSSYPNITTSIPQCRYREPATATSETAGTGQEPPAK